MSGSEAGGNGRPASPQQPESAPTDSGRAPDLAAAEALPPREASNAGASETPTLPPRADAGEQIAENETVPPAAGSPQQAPETRTLPPRPGAHPDAGVPGQVCIPGYEIVGELGRGGMGVVYRARQTKLNRLVALKMILAGGHASEADLARFVTEAEAIARLQHPNIVQIYEVGEFGGLPFFSLEFCPGGSLDKKLAGTPMSPREAAALVETLARAMQVAHEKGVIHRDLKPANVLLAEDGTPKVTDFGLAKKLDDAAGQTASGVIMGTPSYMAPEQAGGKSKDIGPHTDVYTLGAILYELLTGRPPFKAATSLDTIMQVVSDEPVSPRQLQSKTPPDLETVCLKCLQKEPRKRYASAEELAEDLHRFQAGEPIQARPVGRVERAAKWVRRNPVLAGMAAVVVLALLGGTAVSTGFGIVAWRQAELAKNNEADAVSKGEKLAAANETLTRTANDLARKQDELKQNADKLEKTLARSLIRPLALQGGDKPMTEPEWEALWQLAANRPGQLGYRFVEEAARSPATTRQLRDRASVALLAAVGLDEARRAEVESLLLARLDDPAVGEDQKKDLALAAAAWDGLSSPGANRTVRQLIRALRETHGPEALPGMGQGLSASAARLDARDAPLAVAALLQALEETREPGTRSELARDLPAVAARLDARGAAVASARAAAVLLQAMKDTRDAGALVQLGQGLSAVAPPLDTRGAAQAAATLVQVIQDTNDLKALSVLVQNLSAVATRLDTRDAGQAAAILLQAMKDPKNPYALVELAKGLAALAARMDARDAARAAASAAATLVQAIKKSPGTLYSLAEGLAAVAAHMDARDAAATSAQAAAILLQAMQDMKDSYAWALVGPAQGLAAVLAHMPARDAAAVSAQAAAVVLHATKDRNNLVDLFNLGNALSAVAHYLDAKGAGQTATAILELMKDPRHSYVFLAPYLMAVVPRLDARDAQQVASTLVQSMQDVRDPQILDSVVQGLSALAARMDARDAATTSAGAASVLLQAMQDAKDPNALSGLARNQAALTARLDARGAAVMSARAASVLLQAMKDTKDSGTLYSLAQGLSAVAARLDAEGAAIATGQAAARLLQAMRDTGDPGTLTRLGQGLSAVAHYLDAKGAARAAAALLRAMRDTKDPNALLQLAASLRAVAARLDAKEAAAVNAQAAATLLQFVQDPTTQSRIPPPALAALFSTVLPLENPIPFARTASAVTSLAGTAHPLISLAYVVPAPEPLPCRLSTQELVELLKLPTCIGEAPRIVLDQLGNRYRRTFADPWQFIRFAQDQHLELDFTTAPQRPEPAGAATTRP
jgi:tRNA A-37 threonylcarbamoyl transferase component Bud32